jgi:hypothetical protein
MDLQKYIAKIVGLEGLGAYALQNCIYCGTRLKKLPEIWADPERYRWVELGGYLEVLRCPMCGWRHLTKWARSGNDNEHGSCAFGQLKALDLSDPSLPIDEVRSYLAARYQSRFSVNPIVFEETVASVFKSVGYNRRRHFDELVVSRPFLDHFSRFQVCVGNRRLTQAPCGKYSPEGAKL